MDVARKALTMARECGLTLELDEVEVESLIPAGMASDLSTDEFLQELPKVPSSPVLIHSSYLSFQATFMPCLPHPSAETQFGASPQPSAHLSPNRHTTIAYLQGASIGL